MQYVVERLKYSPLVDALTKVEVVPMSCLSLVYSTAFYDKINERIHFELHDEKTSISEHRLCALIRLSQDQSLVNPDSITTGQLFSMFYQMGYTKTLNTITKFKKSCLPPQWNGLFTLLFKGLSERSAGSDGANKSFMTVLYGLYHGIDLDYGSIIWQQLVQSLVSSSRHSEISCGHFWSIITNGAMDRLRVPIMADSLLSSIATFHTTKIIVTDPTKFSFIGSIPEAMLGRISASSNVLQQYRKHPSAGPRELTAAMIRSTEEVTSQPKGVQPKKQKKPARRLILQSTSDSDSEYVLPKHKNTPPSESEGESSNEEASSRGDTPPRSPNPEIPGTEPPITTEPPPTSKPLCPTQSIETTLILGGEDLEFDSTYFSPYRVQSDDDDDEAVTKRHLKAVNEKLDQLLSSSSSGAYSKVALKALFSSFITEHSATLSAAAKAIEASTSQCQQASLDVDASTKECKEATAKVDKLVFEAHLFLDSLQAAAAKNVETVNTSVENLQRSLQSERSNLEVARQAIEAANETLHANFNDRLNQLEAELGIENHIMDELDRCTAQLRLQTHKLCTANAEINDLKSEREAIRMTGVQPKQGGEKVTTQPPSGPKPYTEPKGNEASVSNKEKKKKKIGKDDIDNEDDVYAENPKKPLQKVKTSKKEMEENIKKQRVELEQKRKEAELLEKKKSMLPVWNIDSLQRCAIDEPSILWLDPIMSFGLDNSKDAQFDMPITRKAFIFHCFNSTSVIPSADPKVDRDLLDFYLEFAQPQHLTWSSKKITTVKVMKPYSTGKFINVKFRVTRGTEGSVYHFTLVDLPNLNPHDWILLNNILLSNPQEYQPIIDHVKHPITSRHWVADMENAQRMIFCTEVAKVGFAPSMWWDRARDWWEEVTHEVGLAGVAEMTWEEFVRTFDNDSSLSIEVQHLVREFQDLQQITKTMVKITAKFRERELFVLQYVADEDI
uniref:Uncharacterized protein n=1 Tax=Lactuca sativa TaxID=4236 RepID=A0A9R1XF49_LACSA|nr:hypothetical protein LSAT_V11C400205970 [Lactuca sativa]